MAGMSSLLKFLQKGEEYGMGAADDIAKIFARVKNQGTAGPRAAAKLSKTSAQLIDDIKSGKIPNPKRHGPPTPGMASKSYDAIMNAYEKNPKTAGALLAGTGAAGLGGGAYAMMDDDKPRKRRRAYED